MVYSLGMVPSEVGSESVGREGGGGVAIHTLLSDEKPDDGQ